MVNYCLIGRTEIKYPNHEWGYDIIELYDNSLIIVGARDRYLNGGKNILIFRINNDGDILWEKEIISEKNTDEIAYSISKDNAGGYFIIYGKTQIVTRKYIIHLF